MTTTQGLTNREVRRIIEFLTKANKQQIIAISKLIAKEMAKRAIDKL